MKITSIQTVPIVMPKQDPTWRIALGAFPESRGLALKILTDGPHIGFGYVGADSPYRGSGAAVLQAVFGRFAPVLEGQNPLNLEKILGEVDAISLSHLSTNAQAKDLRLRVDAADIDRARMRVKSAIDVALHDILGKALGVPVYQLLGGLVRQEIPILRIMAIKEPAEMAENALQLCREGYRYLKIKLEGNPTKDIERVKVIRQAVGPETHLTVDANQSYSPQKAIEAIKEMEKYRIELAEQPVPADDVAGLVEVSRKVNCLIEAHESVDTPEKVFGLAKTDFAGCMNVSVTLGGLRSLKTVVDVCRLAKIKCVISCVGTRILSAASMHFVAACGKVDYACQIGEFARFRNDPASGLEVENGLLRVPTSPGLGIEVSLSRK